jgi:cell division protein FtsZ
VSELINVPGFINLDFADVTTIMKNAGYAHMGVGSAKGTDKAQLAAMAAISSPLLETSIAGATGVLVSITASEDIQLEEVETASRMICEEAHPDANIIWGASFAPELTDEMRVTIIATGFIDASNSLKNENARLEAKAQEAAAKAAAEEAAEQRYEAAEPVNEAAFEEYAEPAFEAPKAAPAPKIETAEEFAAQYDDIFKSISFIKRKK